MAISAGQVFVDLGARLDKREFHAYEKELRRVQERTAKREHFKAELGANFDSRAFNAYERELKRAERANDNMVRANGRLRTAFGSVWSRGGAAFAAAGGAVALVAGVKSVVGAYGEAEASSKRVQTAVENVGLSYKEHRKEIDRVIQAQSKLSAFDDEDLADSFARFVTQTKDVNEALKLNALATDVARGRQIGLDQAQRLVARGSQGNATALKRLGIEIDPVTKATDRLKGSTDKVTDSTRAAAKEHDKVATGQRVIAALQDKFGGQARAYGRTQQGAIERVGVAWENLREKLGERLAPTITRVSNRLARLIDEMTNGTGQGGRFAASMERGTKHLRGIGAAALWAFNAFVNFERGVRVAARDVSDVLSNMARGFEIIARAMSKFPGFGFLKPVANGLKAAREELDKFHKHMEVGIAARDVEKDISRMSSRSRASIEDLRKDTAANMRTIRRRMGTDTKEGADAVRDNFRAAITAVRRSMRQGVISTRDGLREIRRLMLAELKEIGIPSALKSGKPLTQDPAAANRAQRYMGGWMGQRGEIGHDTIPAMLAPGEAVLNRHQQGVIEGMLGEGFLDRLFATVQRPHFMARGGRVRFAYGGVTPAIENLIQDLDSKGFRHGSTTGPGHAPGGYHPRGMAVDYGDASNDMQRLWSIVFPQRKRFVELFGPTRVRPGPHLMHNGAGFTDAGLQADHQDHIHMALAAAIGALGGGSGGGVGPALGAVWKAIKAPQTTMDGMLGDVVQGTLDRTTRLANQRGRALAKTAAPTGGPSPGAAAGSVPGGKGAMSFNQLKRLWVSAGGDPARAAIMAHIALSESGGIPSRNNADRPGDGGRHIAAGLWQILGLPFEGNVYDPITNAKMAIAKSNNGRNLHPWDASRAAWQQYASRGGFMRRLMGFAKGKPGKPSIAGLAGQVWDRATGLMGSSGSMPRLVYTDRLGGGHTYAHFNLENGNVAITRGMLAALRKEGSRDHDYALKALVHEFAHARQRFDVHQDPRLAEGGAETFAMWATPRIMRSLGIKYRGAPGAYPSQRAWVGKHESTKWWRSGQFAHFAKGGKADKLVKTVGGATAGLIRKIRPMQTDRSARFDRLMGHVENWDADYGRQERRFNVTDEELVDADTGQVNVEAVRRKAGELAKLIAIRRRIEHELEQAQVVVKRIIASYQRVIRALRNSLRHAKKKNRKGIESYVDQYTGRVTEWKGKLGEVKDSLFDTHTDLLELRAERKSVLGTTAEARDTGADITDTGGDIGGDTGAADTVEAPPTPLQIAEGVAAEIRTFVTGRQDLLASFGRNVVPQSQAAATFGAPDPLTAAAGLRAFGGASTGGLGGATIVNNYNQLPDNTQTWAQQMRFQVEGA